MSWLNIIIIFIVFLTVGYIANLGKNKYIFFQATLLSFILIMTSFLALILGMAITIIIDGFLSLNNGLFTFGLIIILISGTVEFFLIKEIFNRYFKNTLILMMVEYYIQWTLIYLTLYQFITQSLKGIELDIKLGSLFRILDINTLNLTILPVLLISWIAITMIKINED